MFVEVLKGVLVGEKYRFPGSTVEVGDARGRMMIDAKEAIPGVGPEVDAEAPPEPVADEPAGKKKTAK